MTDQDEDRRKFVASCGRFAAVTPPAITLLLSTSLASNAIAASQGRAGYGKGHAGNAYGEDNKNQGWIRRGSRDD